MGSRLLNGSSQLSVRVILFLLIFTTSFILATIAGTPVTHTQYKRSHIANYVATTYIYHFTIHLIFFNTLYFYTQQLNNNSGYKKRLLYLYHMKTKKRITCQHCCTCICYCTCTVTIQLITVFFRFLETWMSYVKHLCSTWQPTR